MDDSEGQNDNMALYQAMDFLEKHLNTGFIHVHSMENTQILLIPNKASEDEESIRALFYQMMEKVNKNCVALCFVGISQIQYKISNINIAYHQARQIVCAYKQTNRSFVKFYRYESNNNNNLFNLNMLNKLYDLLVRNKRFEIQELFDNFKLEVIRHQEYYEIHKSEIFHIIYFVEHAAYEQLKNALVKKIKLYQFQQNNSLQESLKILEDIAYEICDMNDKNIKNQNSEFCEQIYAYLQDNFRRYEITTELAAKELGVSDRYLATFLKEQTGKTFTVALDEIRINFAKECLLQTDWVNNRIAEECGFGATNSYYRIFKKYTGMTPSEYKKSRTS